MHILSVIPFAKIPRPAPQILDYFTSEKISTGGIVQISLGSRKILGVVTVAVPAHEKKQEIKKSAFRLKPIDRVVNSAGILPQTYLSLALFLSDYYYTSLGLALKSLTPAFFSHPTKKFVEKLSALRPCAFKTAQNDITVQQKPVLYLASHNEKAKIRFYEQELRKTLKNKESVLFLVPEIYKIEYFKKQLPILKDASVIHANLTPAKQYEIWEKALLGRANCVMGSRSAIQIPLARLGLIIVDEEESDFYKSFDQQPYVNARSLALKLGELTSAKVILGSDLPSIDSLWNVTQGRYELKTPKPKTENPAQRPVPITIGAKPKITIVDMREELRNKNYSIFSKELQNHLKQVVRNNKQAILFINRRGLASGILCRDCGHIVKCPKCDIAFVFHQAINSVASNKLVCHHCAREENPPKICPQCKSYRIKFIGTGTQRVKTELEQFYRRNELTNWKIATLDLDIAKDWPAQKKIFQDFRLRKYNILIGTQLMLKEQLLPKVDLTSIITIDPMFSIPNFRMNELALRIVDKLRSVTLSQIIFQTYIMDNFVIQNVHNNLLETNKLHKNVINKLLKKELENRREFSFPPFSQLIKLSYHDRNPQKSEREAKILKNKLVIQAQNLRLPQADLQILGPAPAFIPRVNNRYIWQIMIKSKMQDVHLRNALLRVIPSNWKIDVDPIEIL
ncbi:MAG: primosomal protein N' [Candidatus Spechtbacteria bacterium]|nr:primosomal protein N' [Candidatus Spechtbacteria bacterium]